MKERIMKMMMELIKVGGKSLRLKNGG